ncbi:MAG: hypothetical protein ACO3RB_08065, partial [Ilumatobacteraceae bacterium]
LMGSFPCSGFSSKDEIIDNVGHAGYDVFMWVGLVGALMTAAYMTRATWLTFFGEPRGAAAGEHHDEHGAHDDHSDHGHDAHADHGHDDHGHDDHASHGPRESGPLITVPLVILATLALSSGLLNAVPFGHSWENFKKWVEPRAEVVSATGIATVVGGAGEARIAAEKEGEHKSPCGSEKPEGGVCPAPYVKHAEFKWSKAAISLAMVFAGILVGWFASIQVFARRSGPLAGLTKRNKLLGAGHSFLVNKYWLDHLYENVIVRTLAHPVAKAAYWFNQKVLDGIVNAAGTISRTVAGWVYKNVDQRVVDGAVNAAGSGARGAGGALQPVQSGKVNQYGALLFGAAAIGALVLVIINT